MNLDLLFVVTYESEVTRILSNVAYETLVIAADEIVPQFQDAIKKNIENILKKNELKFEIFYDGRPYGRVSLGRKYLEEAITENKEAIFNKVKSQIDELDVKEIVIGCFKDSYDKVVEKFGNVADLLCNIN